MFLVREPRQRGVLELGYTYFGNLGSLLAMVPNLRSRDHVPAADRQGASANQPRCRGQIPPAKHVADGRLFCHEKRDGDPDVRHHNIILRPRYEELLTDIFDRKILAEDFSQYLHIPTLTDPSLAPSGHHAAYTLIPVPNTLGNIDWDTVGEGFADIVLNFLDGRGYIPGLRERLVYRSFVTPDYFAQTLGA
ncbi:hypothetical protein [Sphingomonas oligophenolica]|uniref:hypothetical protein n=1 Tax=Sphingomonas oligophenolica TaxID=301154 RepID=UPI001F4F1CD0|nr:hypothetical protein [Sphingomonas oligophenolica]